MGFGTLFIGYFLLLNIAYYGFTDAVAGIVMLYGVYKLSEINKNFGRGAIATLAFTLFGVFELGYNAYDSFFSLSQSSTTLVSVISIVRYSLIALLSVFIFLGMRDVANEVGLRTLSIKCERLFYMTVPIYSISIILEALALSGLFNASILTAVGIITLVCNVALTILALVCIYSCYMRICMPGEKKDKPEKESRFSFVNAFRRHEEKKRQEYADYKLEKYKKAQEKKKRKNK